MLREVLSQQAPWDHDHDYTIQTVEVYFEADQTPPLDPKDRSPKSNKKYVRLNLGMTILEALAQDNHYIPMYPVLKVVSTDSDFRDSFLKQI